MMRYPWALAVLGATKRGPWAAVSSFLFSTASTSHATTTTTTTAVHRFFILRHGQTDANAGGLIQGSSDFSRLTEFGREQAAIVGREAFRLLPSHADDHHQSTFRSVYVSPLTRARQTLHMLQESNELLLSNANIVVLENLREIDFYQWEGKSKEELQTQYPDSWHAWKVGDPYQLKVPDVNDAVQERYPLLELWDRAAMVWEEIRRQVEVNHSPCNCLIVAHGSLGQALLGTAMGWDATHFRRHEFPNCGMVEIEWNMAEQHVFATRWRWRWPNVSEWNSRNDSDQSPSTCPS